MDFKWEGRAFRARVNPLAACLAAALALGANTGLAAGIASLPNHPANGDSLRPRLPQSIRDDVPRDRWHPVPRDIPLVPAGSIPVTNCNDSGGGSLRQAFIDAVSGDTIDLTNTGCSVITLTTGIIPFFQDDITLLGPGNFGLAVSGGDTDGVLFHGGTGTLEINGVTLRNGLKYYDNSYTSNARGGCVYSSGFVALNDSEVKYCSAQNTGNTYGALGGGVYAALGVTLSNSAVFSNEATATNTFGRGGGIFTPGNLAMIDSSISNNYATTTAGGADVIDGIVVKYSSIRNNVATTVGGIYSKGNAFIETSTVAGNVALQGGGVWLNGDGATTPLTLRNSTISGNVALGAAEGGLFLGGYDAEISNSTIAFNTTYNATKYGAGLRAIVSAVELQSTIIAGNVNIIGSDQFNDDVNGGPTATLSGANNLIGFSQLTPPADTISSDPMLKSLSDNGGTTLTHALSPLSPAIEAGNNTAGLTTDQRGSGFPRVIGAGADIGAYEFDLDDLIFADDFD